MSIFSSFDEFLLTFDSYSDLLVFGVSSSIVPDIRPTGYTATGFEVLPDEVMVPIPEPSTYMTLGAALGVAMRVSRKKKRA